MLLVSPSGCSDEAQSGAGGSTDPGGSNTGAPTSSGGATGAADAYRAIVLADGPVAYWRFEESAGATARDEVGDAHHGTYLGGASLGAPGILAGSSAVLLDGASGCVSVGEVFRFAGRVPFSVEAWVKVSEYGDEGSRIVSTEGYPTGVRSGWNLSASYGDTGYPYFDAWNSEGEYNIYTMGAYAKVSPEGGLLPLGTWSHIVGTYSDTSEEIWVNGVLRDKENQSDAPLPDEGTLSLGCATDGSGPIYLGLHGALDEVAIYDKVLDEPRINKHYQAGRAP